MYYLTTIATLVVGLLLGTNVFSSGHVSAHKLLNSLGSVKDDREVLAALFKHGDDQIADLIEALHDPDPKIRLRAQIVIRYLGNETGLRALEDWYGRQVEIVTSGPIPLPLRGRDYEFIKIQYIDKPSPSWVSAEQYIYALALDGSPRAKALLNEMITKEKPIRPAELRQSYHLCSRSCADNPIYEESLQRLFRSQCS
jgi:hypothetical protein